MARSAIASTPTSPWSSDRPTAIESGIRRASVDAAQIALAAV